jgi:hypothetical protein
LETDYELAELLELLRALIQLDDAETRIFSQPIRTIH